VPNIFWTSFSQRRLWAALYTYSLYFFAKRILQKFTCKILEKLTAGVIHQWRHSRGFNSFTTTANTCLTKQFQKLCTLSLLNYIEFKNIENYFRYVGNIFVPNTEKGSLMWSLISYDSGFFDQIKRSLSLSRNVYWKTLSSWLY
jgi:hypothetical protein